MIHEIDNLRALCGEITAVQALASNARRGFPVEDTVAINLRFANDALGTFLLSDTAASARSWEQTSGENNAYARASRRGLLPDRRDRWIARRTDDARQALRTKGRPLVVETLRHGVIEVEDAEPLQRQLEHFCAVIRGEASPLVTLRDGLQNVRITEAITEAARTGRIVAIA